VSAHAADSPPSRKWCGTVARPWAVHNGGSGGSHRRMAASGRLAPRESHTGALRRPRALKRRHVEDSESTATNTQTERVQVRGQHQKVGTPSQQQQPAGSGRAALDGTAALLLERHGQHALHPPTRGWRGGGRRRRRRGKCGGGRRRHTGRQGKRRTICRRPCWCKTSWVCAGESCSGAPARSSKNARARARASRSTRRMWPPPEGRQSAPCCVRRCAGTTPAVGGRRGRHRVKEK
jgi:hypothetical protein